MADAADARRRAEEALRRVLAHAAAIVRLSWSDGATPSDRANLERIKSAAADIAQDHKILRSLLASLPDEEDLSPLRESAISCTALVSQPPAPQPAPTLPPEVEAAAEKVRRLRWESGLGGNDVLMAATDALLDTIDSARSAAPALPREAEAAAAYQEEMAALGNGVDPALSAALSALARLDKE